MALVSVERLHNPALHVFINCPFDTDYQPLFDAILFATVYCGFVPRSALESDQEASTPRIDRIMTAIQGSRYSIHDLSRPTGSGEKNLARFNMPLELGMAIARCYIDGWEAHDWLAFVPEGYSYLQFISDLSAFDLPRHDNSQEKVVRATVNWLMAKPEANAGVKPQQVFSLLPEFSRRKASLTTEWLGEPPWNLLVNCALETVRIT